MRRVLVAIAILALVQSVSAAVQYEFRQTTQSDLESMPSMDMTGRGVIDGDRSRVEFIAEAFLATGTIRTGNPDLDDLIATENTKIKGFALKQTTSVATTTRRADVPGSKLSDVFRPTRTQIRELTITSIEAKAAVPPDLFVVPATFHKPDPLRDDSQKAPLQILSFTPSNGR